MSVTRETDVAMTAEAFLAWNEAQSGDRRYELLDGQAIAMASERAIHARLKYAVTRCFESAIAEAQLPCEAFVDGMASVSKTRPSSRRTPWFGAGSAWRTTRS